MDRKGWRLPFSLRGSGSVANISSKWQEDVLVMIHLKNVLFFTVKYSRCCVKNHATSAYPKSINDCEKNLPKNLKLNGSATVLLMGV